MRLTLALVSSVWMISAVQDCGPIDEDADGYSPPEDCDDVNAEVNPGASEQCDGIDNNCSGQVDEGCVDPFTIQSRVSYVAALGEDNGRAEPPYFEVSDGTDVPGDWLGNVWGDLEYVSAESNQMSWTHEDGIHLTATSRAGGADDYGYGIGSATGIQYLVVGFEVAKGVPLHLAGTINQSRGNDGGYGMARVGIFRPDGSTVYLITSEEPGLKELHFEGPLDPGEWVLDVQLEASVEMSGGGDAYPSSSVTVELDLLPE